LPWFFARTKVNKVLTLKEEFHYGIERLSFNEGSGEGKHDTLRAVQNPAHAG
jgi:hypothetical protein